MRRFFDTITKGVNPEFEADALKFKEGFLSSDPYTSMADRLGAFWPDRTRRVTRQGACYNNPTPGQETTVDAWVGAVCGGVYHDIKGKRMPCNKGPLDFRTRLIPVAENDIEDEDEDDSEAEDGAVKRSKSKMNPLYAEADHSHVEVRRYANLVTKVLNLGWLPALLHEEKVFRAVAHFMLSFDKPDVEADFVQGLGAVFKNSGLVQFKHQVCHKEDGYHGDAPFPPLQNLVGFSLAQAKFWLEFHPPWVVPPQQPRRSYGTCRRRY